MVALSFGYLKKKLNEKKYIYCKVKMMPILDNMNDTDSNLIHLNDDPASFAIINTNISLQSTPGTLAG